MGLHDVQAGDSRAALKRWLDLDALSPDDAMWLPMLRGEIERVAKAANLDPQHQARSQAATGRDHHCHRMPQPTPEQREAMAQLSPAERQQAIRGMVDGLAARLRDNPNDRDGCCGSPAPAAVLGEAELSSEAFAKAMPSHRSIRRCSPTGRPPWCARSRPVRRHPPRPSQC